MMNIAINLTTEELDEIISLIKKIHGFDFSFYSKASLKRRLTRIMQIKRFSLYDLKHILINSNDFFPGIFRRDHGKCHRNVP